MDRLRIGPAVPALALLAHRDEIPVQAAGFHHFLPGGVRLSHYRYMTIKILQTNFFVKRKGFSLDWLVITNYNKYGIILSV